MEIGKIYSRYQEEIKFAGYALMMGLPAIVLAQMFEQAFGGFSAFKQSVFRLTRVVPLVSFITLVSLLFGIYMGLLILLLLDYKKRFQSLVFLGITVLVVVVAISQGLFFTEAGVTGIAVAIIAAVSTVLLIGGEDVGDIRVGGGERFIDLARDEPLEFPKAERYFVRILGGFVVIALFEAHTDRWPLVQLHNGIPVPNPAGLSFTIIGSDFWIGMDLLASFVFIVGLSLFVGYETERRIVFIGPPRSGKTHCLLGLFIEAQNKNDARNPRGMIEPLKSRFTRKQDWLDPNEAGDIRRMYFENSFGKLFRKNIIVDGLDYP
jgi:hypothetical protein